MIFLKVLLGGEVLNSLTRENEIVTIGSSPDSLVHLTGDDIRPHHAQIDSRISWLTDLGVPPFGVTVNGEATASHVLENGDEIGIGTYTLRFYIEGKCRNEAADTRTWKVGSIAER